MRSPEVIGHLRRLQRNVSINRLLATAPAIKMEEGAADSRVKAESNPSSKELNTIGHVMMVSIKKEEDNEQEDPDENVNTEQSQSTMQDNRGNDISNPYMAETRTASSPPQSVHGYDQNSKQRDTTVTSLPNPDDNMNNPLDLTAHKSTAK